MLSLFEQISSNRVVKSIRKSQAYKTVESLVRFARSGDRIKAADKKILAGLKAMGLITREEARSLERRIIQLEARLNVLEHGGEIRETAERATAARANAERMTEKVRAAKSQPAQPARKARTRPSIREASV